MTRVVFVDPPSPPGFIAFRHAHGGLGEMCRKSRLKIPTLDLFHAATAAKASVVDCVLEDLKGAKAAQAILKLRPDKIFIRTASGSEPHDRAFAKRFDVPVEFFGPQVGTPAPKNLDTLRIPRWDLVDYKKYSFVTSQVSWGCPVGCEYCPYPITQGSRWRSRSPESVVGEFKTLKKRYGIPFVMLRDPYFSFDRKKTETLCRALIKAGSPILWGCETRLDGLSAGLVKLMAEAGCIRVIFGVESATASVLKGVKRPSLSKRALKSKVALLKRHGMLTYAFYVIGLPGETTKSTMKTIELSKELATNAASFSAATPFMGTPLEERARREGTITAPNPRHLTTSVPSMRNGSMSPEEIERLYLLAKAGT